MKKLAEIQRTLKAPKNQRNNFGKYDYRSAEDILEAVKPLLGDATLVIGDEIVEVGGRIYVKATATLHDGEQSQFATGYAREAATKKGMDESQITGAASSYARKYALNGLFCIDDTKDADASNDHKPAKQPTKLETLSKKQIDDIASLIELKKIPLEKIQAACLTYSANRTNEYAKLKVGEAVKLIERLKKA